MYTVLDNFMIFIWWDKWISLRTRGFVNPLVRWTSGFFDEIRALSADKCSNVSEKHYELLNANGIVESVIDWPSQL